MAAKRKKYTFLEEDHMPAEKASLILSAVSAAILAGTVVAAFLMQGQGGMVLGALGLIAALFSFIAFILGMRALSRGEGDQRVTALSAILSGILVIIWVALVFLGIH